MTTAQQLIGMVRSHVSGDGEQFLCIAEQIAGDAGRAGRARFAEQLAKAVEEGRARLASTSSTSAGPISGRGEAMGLLSEMRPEANPGELIVADRVAKVIAGFVGEYRARDHLARFDLKPRRKLLLCGPPGTGKTMTAAVIAGELRLPMFTVLQHGVISKYMGETAANLALVFEAMTRTRGVYLFDEVDALAGSRLSDNDVGEARRVLTAFLHFLDVDASDSVVVAATNDPSAIDAAVFRRFDLLIRYSGPDAGEAARVLRSRLARFAGDGFDWSRPAALACEAGLSHSEVASAAADAARLAVMSGGGTLAEVALCETIRDRVAEAASRSLRG